jgi:DNA/RNA endonuclease YhcR with UshA esterase domain
MTRKQFLAAAYGVGLAALVSMPALAQQAAQQPTTTPQAQPTEKPATPSPTAAKPAAAAPAGMARMKYDAKNEVTVTGTIEDIKMATGKSASYAPESVTLKTETGDVDVHLAPASFWTKNGFTLEKGASIDVTGSKAQIGNSVVVLARTVKKGEKAVTLRNAEGVPAWAHQHPTKSK